MYIFLKEGIYKNFKMNQLGVLFYYLEIMACQYIWERSYNISQDL